MKRIIISLVVIALGFANGVEAQPVKKTTRQQAAKSQPKSTTAKKGATADTVVSLTSVSVNQAMRSSSERFTIADPLVNMLNWQAAGQERIISSSGIVGMPKRSYGLANGKILLRHTTAPSSGTMYGSGAVGTGTAISGVGTGESVLGVNGKSPYAGPWLWGSKLPNRNLPATDSTQRR